MAKEDLLVAGALNAWNANLARANKMFSTLTAEQLMKEVAPGKNRLIYLWGHLTAVHDAMLPLLGLGARLRPEWEEVFIAQPDKSNTALPASEEVKKAWDEINRRLSQGFAGWTAGDWLQRHTAISEEDFAKEPLRNRFAVLLSRTNHLAYHLGQVVLVTK
jgi:hypothetical protein